MQHAAHASIITVAEREYRVRREFDLIIRIEERFGEIGAFILRSESERLKARDLADLYGVLLAGQDDRPTPDAIQQHISACGTLAAFRDVIGICGALFIGEDRFMAQVMERASGNGMAPSPGA